MTRALHGVVHGQTIQMSEALGIPEGQQVEVVVRMIAGTTEKKPGNGFLRTEGALADDSEWDAIMDEIYHARKVERAPTPGIRCAMKFLLDTDVCSAHMRRPARLAHRFFQFTGQLAISSIGLAELYAGAYRHSQSTRLISLIADLRQEVPVLDFDAACSERFGQVRGTLSQRGIEIPTVDLLIASVALTHDLTVVTHNTADFENIPGLQLDDWLTP